MARLIDISLPLSGDLPSWPGSVGCRLTQTSRLEDGAPSTVSRLDTDIHIGTHLDAPGHYRIGGALADELALDDMIGPATVIDVGEAREVGVEELDRATLAPGTRRLLIRTRNDALWRAKVREFRRDYVALTVEAARWIVARGVRLVGIDYLSIQRFGDGPETHHVLLDAGVIVLEGLDLGAAPPGDYELLCLPIRLRGAEGAPVRAVLRTLGDG